MIKLYLIRHCEAIGNSRQEFQGLTDLDVTERGAKQLECLKQRFNGKKIDVIYTSPLIRAYKTALAVKGEKDVPIIELNDLLEINGGNLEGVKWEVFSKEMTDLYSVWDNEPHLFKSPGGESMQQVFDRTKTALNKIFSECSGKTVAITCHGCVIRNIICHLYNKPIEEIKNIGWTDNTSVTYFEVNDDGGIKIFYENDYSHLTEDVMPPRRKTTHYYEREEE